MASYLRQSFQGESRSSLISGKPGILERLHQPEIVMRDIPNIRWVISLLDCIILGHQDANGRMDLRPGSASNLGQLLPPLTQTQFLPAREQVHSM